MWTKTPTEAVRFSRDLGKLTLVVEKRPEDVWQYAHLSMALKASDDIELCKQRWPLAAITLLRAALQTAEEQLEKE